MQDWHMMVFQWILMHLGMSSLHYLPFVFAQQKSSKFKVTKAFFIVQEPRNYGVSNEVNIAKVINFVLG